MNFSAKKRANKLSGLIHAKIRKNYSDRQLNVRGIALNTAGTIMVFFFGMPFRIETGGANLSASSDPTPTGMMTDKIYSFCGFIGLAFIILGAALQIVSITAPPGHKTEK